MEKHTAYMAFSEKEQETFWYAGSLRIIKALEELSDTFCKMFAYSESAGTYTFSYAPSQEDAAFYLAEGEAIFSSGTATISATPGTFLFLPRRVAFRYRVTEAGSASILRWTTPLGFAHQVINMGEPGRALVLPPPPLFEKEERLQQLTARLRAMIRVNES